MLLLGALWGTNASAAFAAPPAFSDMTAQYWGYAPIQWAVDNRIADGYPDGTFQPDREVNEREFLTMLIRAYAPADMTAGDPSSADWAAPYLAYADKLGWNPGVQAAGAVFTRQMAANYLANAAGKRYTPSDSVRYVLDHGLADGKSGGTPNGFQPNDPLTRAEAVTFIQRLKQSIDVLHPAPAAVEPYAPGEIVYEGAFYTLKLPVSWEGRYEAGEIERFATGDTVLFRHKATQGVLFAVTREFEDQWRAIAEETSGLIGTHLTVLGTKDGMAYRITTPTDVQYDPSDEKSAADYSDMAKDVKAIARTFELKDTPASRQTIDSISETPPVLTVVGGTREIPVVQSTYCWNGCAEKDDAEAAFERKQGEPAVVKAGSSLALRFAGSVPPAEVRASTIAGPQHMITDAAWKDGDIVVPSEPGVYIYGLQAIWAYPNGSVAGSVRYDFRIEVE